MDSFVAHASIDIAAPPAKVWEVLVNPPPSLWFGASVATDWQPGSAVTWSGEWEGKPFQDKGSVLEVVEAELLRFTHFSGLSGAADVPENYHTVSYLLSDSTHVELTQDGNGSQEEADRAGALWQTQLAELKTLAETPTP